MDNTCFTDPPLELLNGPKITIAWSICLDFYKKSLRQFLDAPSLWVPRATKTAFRSFGVGWICPKLLDICCTVNIQIIQGSLDALTFLLLGLSSKAWSGLAFSSFQASSRFWSSCLMIYFSSPETSGPMREVLRLFWQGYLLSPLIFVIPVNSTSSRSPSRINLGSVRWAFDLRNVCPGLKFQFGVLG